MLGVELGVERAVPFPDAPQHLVAKTADVTRAPDLGTRFAPREQVLRLQDREPVRPGLRVLLLVLFVVVDDVLRSHVVGTPVKSTLAEVFSQIL